MMSCDQFREVAPDLALGLLAGGERAAAIGHVTTCGGCRQHLDGLVKVADELLLLAPEVEPDIGFESRVIFRLSSMGTGPASAAPASAAPTASPAPSADPTMARSTPSGTSAGTGAAAPTLHRRRLRRAPRPGAGDRRWSRPLTVAAVVVLVLAAAATTWAGGLSLGRAQGRSSASSSVARVSNQLVARTVVVWADHGRSTCQLVAFPKSGSQPARLVIHLDEPGVPREDYQVFAVPVHGGPEVPVGTITVADTEGTLTAAIPSTAGPVDAVRVTDGSGTTKYWAMFAAV